MNPDALSAALERTLARTAAAVRRAAWGHALAEADADDLVQEVRIRLWRALASGERIESVPSSYVYRAAQSAARDLIRQRRARREAPLPDDPPPEVHTAGGGRGPADLLEEGELAERVAMVVETLAEPRRAVVRMYLAGYRAAEIEDLLGWSEPKVRNLLYRGLADLRGRLTEMGIGPEGIV